MTTPIRSPRRRFITLLGAGSILAVLPVGFGFDPETGALRLMPPAAYAGDDDDDNSDRGGGDDRDDDRDADDDRDDDQDDDRDDERDEREDDRDDRDDDDRDDADDDRSGTGSGGDDGGRTALPDISLRYNDGWIEQIVNDRYELFDDKGRRVIRRRANLVDYNRMVALLG